jgi:hypothetical protein
VWLRLDGTTLNIHLHGALVSESAGIELRGRNQFMDKQAQNDIKNFMSQRVTLSDTVDALFLIFEQCLFVSS